MAFILTMLIRAIMIIVVLVASWFIVSFLLTFFGSFLNIPTFTNIGKGMRDRFIKAANSLLKF